MPFRTVLTPSVIRTAPWFPRYTIGPVIRPDLIESAGFSDSSCAAPSELQEAQNTK
jgi:hypothetical protein